MSKEMKVFSPSGRPLLFLLELLFRFHGEAKNKDLKIKVDPSKGRKQLVEEGFITEVKKPDLRFELTDKAWLWFEENMGQAFESKSPAAVHVLHYVLSTMKKFMLAGDISLIEFIQAEKIAHPTQNPRAVDQCIEVSFQGEAPSEASAHLADGSALSDAELYKKIKSTYFSLTQNKPNIRVHLHELKCNLTDISQERINELLLSAHRSEDCDIVLYQLDDAAAITDEDRESAIYIAGHPFHIVFMEQSA